MKIYQNLQKIGLKRNEQVIFKIKEEKRKTMYSSF